MHEITELKMRAISLINEIFVPLGLKPIEDLPQACPGNGKHCVLALILQTNPAWNNVWVSEASTVLNWDDSMDATVISFPKELVEFIKEFDCGNIPDLISLKSMDEHTFEGDYDTYISILGTIESKGIDIGDRLDFLKETQHAVPLLALSNTEEGID